MIKQIEQYIKHKVLNQEPQTTLQTLQTKNRHTHKCSHYNIKLSRGNNMLPDFAFAGLRTEYRLEAEMLDLEVNIHLHSLYLV